MKIAKVETLVVNLPMIIEGATPMLGGRPRTSIDMLLVLASIHLIAALAPQSVVERFYFDFAANPLGDAIHPVGGRIGVPQGPGLGVDPDPRLVERLRVG